jgi:hypothetical protein
MNEQQVMKYAEQSGDYRTMLIRYLDDLTVYYEALVSKMIKGEFDEELIDGTLAKMIIILNHIYPKVEGSPKLGNLKKELNLYRPWFTKSNLPKVNKDEAARIPRLFELLLKSYHVLGLTNY